MGTEPDTGASDMASELHPGDPVNHAGGDAALTALLASLPVESMPAEVAGRLNDVITVLAAERSGAHDPDPVVHHLAGKASEILDADAVDTLDAASPASPAE